MFIFLFINCLDFSYLDSQKIISMDLFIISSYLAIVFFPILTAIIILGFKYKFLSFRIPLKHSLHIIFKLLIISLRIILFFRKFKKVPEFRQILFLSPEKNDFWIYADLVLINLFIAISVDYLYHIFPVNEEKFKFWSSVLKLLKSVCNDGYL